MNSLMIRYRRHPNWKYLLHEPATCQTPFRPKREIDTPFITLEKSGRLKVAAGYAWDGSSGPAFDTRNSMRGSLFHDALYQLMRLREIPECWRDEADELYRAHCLADGMSKLRAWWRYNAVRSFGASACKPRMENRFSEILTAP